MTKEESDVERAMRLGGLVGELLPELKPEHVRSVVSAVFEQVTSITNETEGHFKMGKRELDVSAVVSVMIQGALAVVCEGHPPEDIRGRLWRAGREVGEFVTERWQRQIAAEMAEAERRRAGEAS